MTEETFKKDLLSLFKNYSQEPDPNKIKLFSVAISKSVGFKHDWNKIFLEILTTERFFPNLAVIVEYVNKNSSAEKSKTPRQQAIELVDKYILYLTGVLSYEDLSQYDHAYFKKRFSCDKYSVHSGSVNPTFKRKEWVEIAEIDFQAYEATKSLPFMEDYKNFLTDKEPDGEQKKKIPNHAEVLSLRSES